jgi:hypothetical protein
VLQKGHPQLVELHDKVHTASQGGVPIREGPLSYDQRLRLQDWQPSISSKHGNRESAELKDVSPLSWSCYHDLKK